MERINGLRIIKLEEYILSHGGLSKQLDRGETAADNLLFFKLDLRQRRLNRYQEGSYVAYHKGVLCGQSSEGLRLFNTAKEYYGSSNLAVFKIPKKDERLSELVGVILGDGNVSSYNSKKGTATYQVRIAGNSIKDFNYIIFYLKPLIENLFKINE